MFALPTNEELLPFLKKKTLRKSQQLRISVKFFTKFPIFSLVIFAKEMQRRKYYFCPTFAFSIQVHDKMRPTACFLKLKNCTENRCSEGTSD